MSILLEEKLEIGPLKEYFSSPLDDKRQSAKKRQRDRLVAELLDELQARCAQERGRQVQVAKILGVDRRRLNDWFSGRISPTLAVGLRIQEFLKTQKKEAK